VKKLQAASQHLTRALWQHDATGDEAVRLKQFKTLNGALKKDRGYLRCGQDKLGQKKIVKSNLEDNDSAKSVR
jgi:hypothetical protein